jgi:colanic acid/amylovoran biosynthesis protein
MKNLIVEINGTGTHNRGAELMAIAIADRLRATFPGIQLVVSRQFGTDGERQKHGLLTTWEHIGRLGSLRSFMNMLKMKGRADVISPASVDVVLDASGFAFSDQWGESRPRKLVTMMSRRYRRGQTLILMPQALGTFNIEGVAVWSRRLMQRAALVCARDSQSRAAVEALGGCALLRQYPDFTVAVAPAKGVARPFDDEFAAIVPNVRMLDKTGVGGAYLAFLRHAITEIRRNGMRPVIVLHDADEDRAVVGALGGDFSSIDVVTHDDPRVLKAILGQAEFVIGSRFHALVSSMSQGVPCIGAGWSHKYPELFADFDCPELLMADLEELEHLGALVAELSGAEARSSKSSRIKAAADELKSRCEKMWLEVEALIRSHQ